MNEYLPIWQKRRPYLELVLQNWLHLSRGLGSGRRKKKTWLVRKFREPTKLKREGREGSKEEFSKKNAAYT
jgi:hypothetical protein